MPARIAVLAVALGFMPFAAYAQDAAPRTISCDGPITKDADQAKLIELFGAANVAFQEVSGAEGETAMATVVFPKDARSRLEISWQDEAARKRPAAITISDRSQWTGPKGLKIGTTLAEVEKLNGKPFELSGFDWDYGGFVTGWRGGALPELGGCTISLRFRHADKVSASALRPVIGDVKLMSSAANVRAAKPTVSEIVVAFPE
jgi:hypothetical protein